jgi:hypothetical protein
MSQPRSLSPEELEELADRALLVPGLSTEGRKRLLALAAVGIDVDIYTHTLPDGEEWVLWVRELPPHYEARWSVAAWSAYCRGTHLDTLDALCQCQQCQDRRFALALAEYRRLHPDEEAQW